MGALKGDVVKRCDCILVYGSIIKGDVVKRSDCSANFLRTYIPTAVLTSCEIYVVNISMLRCYALQLVSCLHLCRFVCCHGYMFTPHRLLKPMRRTM